MYMYIYIYIHIFRPAQRSSWRREPGLGMAVPSSKVGPSLYVRSIYNCSNTFISSYIHSFAGIVYNAINIFEVNYVYIYIYIHMFAVNA